jgi:hypothetical protein
MSKSRQPVWVRRRRDSRYRILRRAWARGRLGRALADVGRDFALARSGSFAFARCVISRTGQITVRYVVWQTTVLAADLAFLHQLRPQLFWNRKSKIGTRSWTWLFAGMSAIRCAAAQR